MSTDFDEWFDKIKINPVYVIQTNLEVIEDPCCVSKQPQPSKLFDLLKRPTEYKVKKRTVKLVQRIKSSFVLFKS